jgi:CHAT domain/Subtilase family/AAA ATPase domain
MSNIATSRSGERLFEPFDLTVTLGPNNLPWLSASSRIGLVHGIPRVDAQIPPLDDLLDYAHDYRDAIQFAQTSTGAEISGALARIVFGDPLVLELFQATRGAAADRGRPTLVRILASPHLASLPWELLPDPAARRDSNRPNYLTLAADAHVVRQGRARTYAPRNRILTPPLHLLIVLSSPSPGCSSDDYLSFDIYEVKRSLLQELQPLIDSGVLIVDIEDRPTLENLRRRIGRRAQGFQLFHYVGHAMPDRLVMEDVRGQRADQDSARITEILRLCPDLRLVVFAGCETARARSEPTSLDPASTVGWRDLISVADRCVQEAAPMVVGMQAVLPFRTERIFTRFFYQGLASGYSIAEAVKLARGATQSDARVSADLLEWSVPALFLGGTDPGPLISRAAVQKLPPPPPQMTRVLKADLRQSETRFFARDTSLRHAVDVLAGRSPERVLVITGAMGVGKTMLVDRALEELTSLDQPPSHILYVKASRLAGPLTTMPDRFETLRGGARQADEGLAVRLLCEDIERLLRPEGEAATGSPALPIQLRWDALVEKLTVHRFVLVIDEFESFDDRVDASFDAILPLLVLDAMRDSGLCRGPARRSSKSRAAPARRMPRATSSVPLGVLLDSVIALLGRDSHARHSPEAVRWYKAITARLAALAPDQSAVLVAMQTRSAEQLFNLLRESDAQTLEDAAGMLQQRAFGETPETISDRFRYAQSVDRARENLERALATLARRRSSSRIGIITTRAHPEFLGLRPSELFEMRLGHLTWAETWRWVRRNLPGLLRCGEEQLSDAWSCLGPDLARWEELERRIVSSSRKAAEFGAYLEEVKVAPRRRRVSPRLLATRRRGQRPLRIAIAGPQIRSHQHVAQALTRVANQHGIGGRVVLGAPTGDSALAIVIDEPSPFRGSGAVGTRRVLDWLEAIAGQRPDIVLMDYGQPFPADSYELRHTAERFVAQRHAHRCLFVAAAGNYGPMTICEPAIFPEILAVGAIDEVGALRDFTTTAQRFGKPDLVMLDDLDRLGVGDAFLLQRRNAERFEGTGFAAFHAVLAATLTWSLVPERSPRELTRLLMSAAGVTHRKRGNSHLPILTIEAALAHARYDLITRTLSGGPCSTQTLAAVIGQDTAIVEQSLNEMLARRLVHRISGDRFERFELLQ